MGSSTSKPRKGHEHPKHLPKVGTPENRAWHYRTRYNQVFGSTPWRVLVIAFVVLALISLTLLYI